MASKQVSRLEDMSHDGQLILLQQRDGDMIVNIRPSKGDRDYEGSPFGVTVEFCVSGGRSPKTLNALRQLMLAMEEDNREWPIDTALPRYKSHKEVHAVTMDVRSHGAIGVQIK